MENVVRGLSSVAQDLVYAEGEVHPRFELGEALLEAHLRDHDALLVSGGIHKTDEKVLLQPVDPIEAEADACLNKHLGLAEASAPEHVELMVAAN